MEAPSREGNTTRMVLKKASQKTSSFSLNDATFFRSSSLKFLVFGSVNNVSGLRSSESVSLMVS